MKRLILTACALLVVACSTGSGKVGIVTPPENQVNYDPSTVDGGLAARVGFRVYNPLGTQAWDKTGTGNSAWTAVPMPSATTTAAGLMTAVQAIGLQGNATPVGCWVSPTIDLTSSGSTGITMIPSITGYILDSQNIRGQVTGVAGTLSVQPTFTFGNDSGQSNVGGSSGSYATSFAAGKNAGMAMGAVFSTGIQQIDLATPVTLKMGTLASGSGLTFTSKIIICGTLVPTA